VGARATSALAERWSLTLRATGGGFGVGADSEWGAFGAVTWRKSDRLSFTGGYRHLAVDYEDARLRYDVSLTGPILGLAWRY